MFIPSQTQGKTKTDCKGKIGENMIRELFLQVLDTQRTWIMLNPALNEPGQVLPSSRDPPSSMGDMDLHAITYILPGAITDNQTMGIGTSCGESMTNLTQPRNSGDLSMWRCVQAMIND